MVVNVQIDEELLKEALAVSKESTVNLLVEVVLREYVQRRQQQRICDLFGTIDYEDDYDYKQQRQVI